MSDCVLGMVMSRDVTLSGFNSICSEISKTVFHFRQVLTQTSGLSLAFPGIGKGIYVLLPSVFSVCLLLLMMMPPNWSFFSEVKNRCQDFIRIHTLTKIIH